MRLNGYSYEMIAKSIGKTPKSIERTLDRIRNKLKDVINEIIWLFYLFVLIFS